jgi:hypothetical protein
MMGLFASVAETSAAGPLVMTALSYRTSSLAPLAEEPTPNYFSYGPTLNLGWSIGQVVDVAGFVQYAPSRTRAPSLKDEALQLVRYGGELGLRIRSLFYLGLRGGVTSYRMFHRRSETELPGQWRGRGYGMSLGALGKINKVLAAQLTFDLDTAELGVGLDGEPPSRRIDTFGVSLGYTFNGFDDFLVSNVFMKSFIDSLGD